MTALAVAARLPAMGQPMRFDESVSWAYFVGKSWSTIVSQYQAPNNHVFYSLLAKLFAAPVGYAPWALRLPALLAGVAIVPLTYLVGRRFADERTALLAAALTVGATPLVLFSTNARGYSLVGGLFLVLLLIADSLRTRVSVARWAAFAMVAAIGVYTIPVMLYPLGVAGVWLALVAWLEPPIARVRFTAQLVLASAAAAIMAGLLYLPIIRSAGVGALTGNKFVTPVPWREFVASVPLNVGGTLASWVSPLSALSMPPLVLIAVLGVVVGRAARRERRRASLALATALWCTVLLVITHRVPFVRVWLFMLPLFALALASGCWWLVDLVARHRVQRGVIAAPLLVGGFVLALGLGTHAAEESGETGIFKPAFPMTRLLASRLHPGDRVLAPIPSYGPLLYYFPRAGLDPALLTVPLEQASRAFIVLDTRHGQSLAWAVTQQIIDPSAFAEPVLVARYADGELWETRRR